MYQPFKINRNLLTCIKSTFSLTSPGFCWKKVLKIDRQFTWVQKWLGGGWEDKSWQNIYYSWEQFTLPISLPGDQKDSLLSYGATDRGTLWRVLAGSHWWRLVELLAWTNHGQAQPGQSSTWLASESRPWWLHSEGPRVLHVPVQGAAQRPPELPRHLCDIYIDPVCICIGPQCLPLGNYNYELSLSIIFVRGHPTLVNHAGDSINNSTTVKYWWLWS